MIVEEDVTGVLEEYRAIKVCSQRSVIELLRTNFD